MIVSHDKLYSDDSGRVLREVINEYKGTGNRWFVHEYWTGEEFSSDKKMAVCIDLADDYIEQNRIMLADWQPKT